MIEASEHELVRARQRMAVQDAVADALGDASDLRAAAPRILQVLCDGLHAVVGILRRPDLTTGRLQCFDLWHAPHAVGPSFIDLTRQLTFAPGTGLPGRIWASGQPAWAATVTGNTDVARAAAELEAGLHVAIAFPILARGTVLGVVELLGRTLDPPDAELLAMLRSTGSQVGQFIRRARAEEERLDLLAREQAARREAEAAQARLMILAEAGDRLAATIGFEGTLREVAWLVLPALADWSAIDIVQADGSTQRVAAAHPNPVLAERLMAMQPPRHAADDTLHLVARVLRTGRPWSLGNITDAEVSAAAYSTSDAPLLSELRPRSAVAVPLTARGRTLGVLSFASAQPDRYGPADLALAVNLARRCALAIDNARLLQEAQQEIARREQAEEAMRTSRDQLEAILRGVTDGITVQTPQGQLAFANDAAAAIIGFASAQELLAANLGELMRSFVLLDEQGAPLPLADLPGRRALQGEHVPGVPLRFRILATGQERWSMVAATPVLDADGKVQFAVNIFHDVTEQKRSEERLRFLAEAGALLPTSLDVQDVLSGIARLAVGTLADWSAVYVLGDGDVVQHLAVAHVDPTQEQHADELLRRYPPIPDDTSVAWRVLRSGEAQLMPDVPDELLVQAARDAEHLRLLRSLRARSLLWLPLIARGRMLGALGLFISESGRRFTREDQAVGEEIARRAALAIDNARLYHEAQDAIRARDQFLSIASHELKTPVAGIKVAVQMLQRAQARDLLDPERLARTLRNIDQTTSRLGELTEDLLDVARLRLGQLSLHVQPLDLGELVADAAGRFRDQLDDQRRFELMQSVAPGACIVEGDAVRLQQVLANLLDNALKYSPETGRIQLELQLEGAGCMMVVRDQGIGLSEGSAERIFEPFGRAPNAERQHIPGMGLGLYICRNIVDRHGGRIWAESPGEDRGTAICVWLPLAACSAHVATGPADIAG